MTSALYVITRVAEEVNADSAFTGRRVGVGFNERHLDQGRALLHRRTIDALVMAFETDAGIVIMREVRAGDSDSLSRIDALLTRLMPQAVDLGSTGTGVPS